MARANQGQIRRGYLVIGAGVRGRLFIQALQYLAPSAPIWVYDVFESRMRYVITAFGALPCSYADITSVGDKVAMTIIASPVSTHLNYAILLASRSRRLLTEKPLLSAVAAAAADPIMPGVINDYKDRVWIGYSERVHPHAASYRETISTALGRRAEGAMLTCRRMRATSNMATALEEIAIHDLDLLTYSEPHEIEITSSTESRDKCEIVGRVDRNCNFRIVGAITTGEWATETAYSAPGRRTLKTAAEPYGDSERLVGITAMLEAVHDGHETGYLKDVDLEARLWATIAPFIERDVRV
jgi:predicted dehydrogenase